MSERITKFCTKHPYIVILFSVIITLFALFQLPKIKIDTDPENMLSEHEFVREYHDQVKEEFSLFDFIILGIVNENNPNGVFNVNTLQKVFRITEYIKNIDGVIKQEIIAPSTKDNIKQAGLGTINFQWLMPLPPETEEEAKEIMKEAMDNPLYKGTMISEDGKALCIYVPIEKKDMSYKISQDILKHTKTLHGNEQYHITGLPVAEDTFGIQMFKQMAISAPLAALIIFLLLWIFFKKLSLICSPMIVAFFTVLSTMGALIGSGFTVHIMSSMIPIFLMPISVVDSVHILSDFFDSYQHIRDRKKTILHVMKHLFMPMLYTSLTTAIGFLSLALTPIPPVQVFGIFVAMGVMLAWLLTITFIPAYLILIPEKFLENILPSTENIKSNLFSRFISKIGLFATNRSKYIITAAIIIVFISIYGISKINVNDNPVKWFTKSHPIRIADKILNEHFGGTYTAYLTLEAKEVGAFKNPEILEYIEKIQRHLMSTGKVGKTSSLADVVKKIYSELMDGNKDYYKIPNSIPAVAQCLISFENSHKPDDLWHLVSPDYKKVNLWIQLKSGDNKNMSSVLENTDAFLKNNAPPFSIKHNWAGLTYVNVIWQNKMVYGMLKSLLGSFIIVFFIMAFLFRSPLWGLLSMIPLSLTILFTYGLIGFAGKNYDMPVAVLSALTLGLSIDFAIHFLERTKQIYKENSSWEKTSITLFQEPARAITRNAIVIAIGFTPLLAAPLIPYRTVGFFMAAIMTISSLSTLFLLPSLITLFKNTIFKNKKLQGGI